MATRSTISLLTNVGTIVTVYCHWDGYLEHNGKILHDHYTTMANVQDLLSLGAISALDKDIIDTVYYYRDREQSWETSKPGLYSNWEYFINNMYAEEFNYIFADGEWYLIQGETPENMYMTQLSMFEEINHPDNKPS